MQLFNLFLRSGRFYDDCVMDLFVTRLDGRIEPQEPTQVQLAFGFDLQLFQLFWTDEWRYLLLQPGKY